MSDMPELEDAMESFDSFVTDMREKRYKNDDKNCWFEYISPDETFYSPFKTKKSHYVVIGKDDTRPTPREMVDYLNKTKDAGMHHTFPIGEVESDKEFSGKQVTLPGGYYRYETASTTRPSRLVTMTIREDSFVKLPEYYDKLTGDISAFLGAEAHYRRCGAMYRFGAMLYGSPGQGKTSILRNIIKDNIPKDAIVIFLDCIPSNSFIECVRATLANRLKMFVFEEMMLVVNTSSKVERILDFLDGELSVDNAITIGTTNYPERLPGNIIDRPGRFDELYHFDNPSKGAAKLIAEHYLGRLIDEDENVVLKGLSSAAIKETCLKSLKSNMSLKDSAAGFKKRAELVKKEFGEMRSIGLNKGHSHDDWDD